MILMIECGGHICSKIRVSFVHVNHCRMGHQNQARATVATCIEGLKVSGEKEVYTKWARIWVGQFFHKHKVFFFFDVEMCV